MHEVCRVPVVVAVGGIVLGEVDGELDVGCVGDVEGVCCEGKWECGAFAIEVHAREVGTVGGVVDDIVVPCIGVGL